jgi:hypothetical protein
MAKTLQHLAYEIVPLPGNVTLAYHAKYGVVLEDPDP